MAAQKKPRKGNRPEEIEVTVEGTGVAFDDGAPPERPPDDGNVFGDELPPLADELGEFDARPAPLPDFALDDDNVFADETLDTPTTGSTPVAQPTLVPVPPAVVFDEVSIVVSGDADVQWAKGKSRGIADVRIKVKREIHGAEVTAIDWYVPGAAAVHAAGMPGNDADHPPLSGLQVQRNNKSEDVLLWTLAGPDGGAMDIGEAVVDVASISANSGKTMLTLAVKFFAGMDRLAALDALQGAVVVLRGRRLQGGLFSPPARGRDTDAE